MWPNQSALGANVGRRREVEIFGAGDDLPEDEWTIVFDSNLPHDEMMAELRMLRARKQVKSRSFAERMTQADRIRAHALGIGND